MAENKYGVDYGKRAANCKKCKKKIEKGALRLAKITANPFAEDTDMKLYFHPECLFETFLRARATTRIIESAADIDGFGDIQEGDKKSLVELIEKSNANRDSNNSKGSPSKKTPVKKGAKNDGVSNHKNKRALNDSNNAAKSPAKKAKTDENEASFQMDCEDRDCDDGANRFKEFRRLVVAVASESSYLAKTEIIRQKLDKGEVDLELWLRLLLPGVVDKRVYNLQSRQLIKLFARIFAAKEKLMQQDLEQGDVAATIGKFFEQSQGVTKPLKKSKISMRRVDNYLAQLTKITREEEQMALLKTLASECTANDLIMSIRLIVHDLRMTAGAKHVLDGVHAEAYDAFNQTRNISKIVDQIKSLREQGNSKGPLEVGATLMLPLQPMLAAPCRSVDMAFEKCPKEMCAEIKYDGERVQVHKKGHEFKFFSRSLKPVMPHKVSPFKEFIPKAFPDGSDLILDAEVLMVDCNTGLPLPFGTLGIHKGSGFKDAVPCLFVFDCIYYNGRSLMREPLKKRKEMMKSHMVEVGNHIKFSETYSITEKTQLGNLIKRVFQQGLEGLVLKCFNSEYKPGKRHWLKVKKDYLNEGKMADSADLVVLGAWYGTGNKGGLMSVFLMGTCMDKERNLWGTVTKVHTGHDDKTLKALQKELGPLMNKIKQNQGLVPDWLSCKKAMVPDFVVKSPQDAPVWEITGAEFTKSADLHTGADGISIRFPRVTRIRNDKSWEQATSADELRELFRVSKEKADFDVDYSNTSESTSKTTQESSNSRDEEDLTNTSYSQTTDNDDKDEVEEEEESGGYSDDTDVDEPTSPISEMSNFKDRSKSDAELDQLWVRRRYNKTKIVVSSGITIEMVDSDDVNDNEWLVVPLNMLSGDKFELETNHKFLEDRFKTFQKELKKEAFTKRLYVPKNLSTKTFFLNVKGINFGQLEDAMEFIRERVNENGGRQIVMPVLAKNLNWNAVRTLVKNVFLNELWHIRVAFNAGSLLKGKTASIESISPRKKPKSDESQEECDASLSSTPIQKLKKKGKDKTNNTFKNGKNDIEDDDESKTKSIKDEEIDENDNEGFDLPNIFNNKVFSLTKIRKDLNALHRLIIAYGGDVSENNNKDNVDYFVVDKMCSDINEVSVAWIRACIEQRQFLPRDEVDAIKKRTEDKGDSADNNCDEKQAEWNGTKNKNNTGFEIVELQGDLFANLDDTASLAHCISADCKMSKGFAELVRDKIVGTRMSEIKSGKVGDIIAFKMDNDYFLYNLVTKEKYFGKPTYDTLKSSLKAMLHHVLANDVKKILMPRIGCGLDRLEWHKVKKIIEETFRKTKISIQVFHL